MKVFSLSLTVAFGLAVGLSACQDQSVVAPDDQVVPPGNLEILAKKGGKTNPSTKEVGFLSGFDLPGGPSAWDVVRDDGTELSLSVFNESFESNLASTAGSVLSGYPEGGFFGACKYDPADTPAEIMIALAEQLDGPQVDPWPPDPYLFPHNTLFIDRTALAAGETSEDNRVQFGYSSLNPVFQVWSKKKKQYIPGSVVIRVGGVLRIGDFGHPTVTREVVGDEERFTFTGGTVSVTYWDGGKPKPRLECVLLDEVRVSVNLNPGT